MEPEFAKVGDIVFAQTWEDLQCQAVATQTADGETFCELRILADGALVWTSPSTEFNDDDFAFGSWSDGDGLPCLFEDIDLDGRPEILAPVPKGDLVPTVYRIFRWDGQTLSLTRKVSLLRNDHDVFEWAEADFEDDSPLAWVDYFEDGLAHIVQRRRTVCSRRTLHLKPVANGFAEAT